MGFGNPGNAFRSLELRLVSDVGDGDAGTADVRVYVLLPTLEELLGRPDFGHAAPILLPGHRRPLDGWSIFGSARQRGLIIH